MSTGVVSPEDEEINDSSSSSSLILLFFMDQWIDSASFEHFGKLFLAGAIAGFFGIMLYDLIVARTEAQIGIPATGSV